MAEGEPGASPPTEQIRQILTFGDGTKLNLIFACYNIIRAAPEDEQGELVGFLAESIDELESSKEVRVDEVITEQERLELKKLYAKTIDAVFDSLIAQNEPSGVFYQRLWTAVNSPIFPDDKAQAFALYWVMIDRKIPYFQVEPGMKMANEEFKKRLSELRNDRVKIRFLLERDFSQRTEQADLILKVIQNASEMDRPVLMAYLIAIARMDQDSESQLEMLRRALRS